MRDPRVHPDAGDVVVLRDRTNAHELIRRVLCVADREITYGIGVRATAAVRRTVTLERWHQLCIGALVVRRAPHLFEESSCPA